MDIIGLPSKHELHGIGRIVVVIHHENAQRERWHRLPRQCRRRQGPFVDRFHLRGNRTVNSVRRPAPPLFTDRSIVQGSQMPDEARPIRLPPSALSRAGLALSNGSKSSTASHSGYPTPIIANNDGACPSSIVAVTEIDPLAACVNFVASSVNLQGPVSVGFHRRRSSWVQRAN